VADLSGPRDRGQIILIAAFALGVVFIALALVINAAIFTENLASRGETTGASDALQYRQEVEDNVGTLVGFANYYNDSSQSALEDAVSDSIANVSVQGGRQSADTGAVVSVSAISSTSSPEFGTRINQSDSSTFEGTSLSNWIVVTDVSDVRAVRINVTDISQLDGNEETAFDFVLEDSSGTEWNMSVFDPAGSDLAVRVDTPDNTARCERSVPDTHATIDVTGGTVAGEPCHALTDSGGQEMHIGTGVSPDYTIRYRNGSQIEGNYSMVVDEGVGFGLGSDFPATSTDPDSSEAIYNLSVSFTYQKADLRYETRIRVAPGESDE